MKSKVELHYHAHHILHHALTESLMAKFVNSSSGIAINKLHKGIAQVLELFKNYYNTQNVCVKSEHEEVVKLSFTEGSKNLDLMLYDTQYNTPLYCFFVKLPLNNINQNTHSYSENMNGTQLAVSNSYKNTRCVFLDFYPVQNPYYDKNGILKNVINTSYPSLIESDSTVKPVHILNTFKYNSLLMVDKDKRSSMVNSIDCQYLIGSENYQTLFDSFHDLFQNIEKLRERNNRLIDSSLQQMIIKYHTAMTNDNPNHELFMAGVIVNQMGGASDMDFDNLKYQAQSVLDESSVIKVINNLKVCVSNFY